MNKKVTPRFALEFVKSASPRRSARVSYITGNLRENSGDFVFQKCGHPENTLKYLKPTTKCAE